jgi:hypothetical protein
MTEHCQNLAADRAIGQYWERQFCIMARDYGFMFSPLQIGRDGSAVAYKGRAWNTFTLPDVVIWTYPGQHHEIKHKNPMRNGCFGLERYRYEALRAFAAETRQDVFYTIHNHDLSGGRDAKENKIAHWLTVSIVALDKKWTSERRLASWVNGESCDVITYFWPASLWSPLLIAWEAARCKQ